jgi:hypothetical protein
MTYTDEADDVIRATPRTLEPGDVVCHEDGFGDLGHVLEQEDDGYLRVYWPTGKCTSVRGNRLRLMERPSAYLAVSFQGCDEVSGTRTSYCFAISDTPEIIARDKDLFDAVEGYTVLSYRLPEESVPDDDDELEPEELDPEDDAEAVTEGSDTEESEDTED